MKKGALTGRGKRPAAPKTIRNRERLLVNYAIPALGERPLAEIDKRNVGRVLAGIESCGGPVDETLKVIRGVFSFAESRGM